MITFPGRCSRRRTIRRRAETKLIGHLRGAREMTTRTSGPGPRLRRWATGSRRSGSSGRTKAPTRPHPALELSCPWSLQPFGEAKGREGPGGSGRGMLLAASGPKLSPSGDRRPGRKPEEDRQLHPAASARSEASALRQPAGRPHDRPRWPVCAGWLWALLPAGAWSYRSAAPVIYVAAGRSFSSSGPSTPGCALATPSRWPRGMNSRMPARSCRYSRTSGNRVAHRARNGRLRLAPRPREGHHHATRPARRRAAVFHHRRPADSGRWRCLARPSCCISGWSASASAEPASGPIWLP